MLTLLSAGIFTNAGLDVVMVRMKKISRQQSGRKTQQKKQGHAPQQVFSRLFHFYKVKQKIKITKFGL